MRLADPFLNGYFILELGSVWEAEFTECSGLENESEVVWYEEGGENTHATWFRGRNKTTNLVLKHGVSRMSPALWAWREAVIHRKQPPLLDGAVLLMDEQGKERIRWSFRNAMPVKWQGPQLKAGASELAIETLELTYEDLRVKVTDLSGDNEPAITHQDPAPAPPADKITAAFTVMPAAVVEGGKVQLTDTSTSTSRITTWEWSCKSTSWSDSKQHPQVQMDKVGVHTITLKVTNEKGKSDSTTRTVTVTKKKKDEEKDELVASFVPDPDRLGEWEEKEFSFKDTSTSTSKIVKWAWENVREDWNDTVQHPKKKFTKPGHHDVTLIVTNEKGNSEQAKRTVTVIPDSIEADFDLKPDTVKEWEDTEVSFTDKSTSRSAITTWAWSGSSAQWTASEQHPKGKFKGKPGTHTISLTVTNKTGKKSTTRKELKVIADRLEVAFDPTPEVVNAWEDKEIQFKDKSTSLSPIKTWKYSAPSAGYSASEQHPRGSFKGKAGTHEVTLEVTNEGGKSGKAVRKIKVIPDHISAAFHYMPERVEASREVSLLDDSTSGSAIQKWEWSCPGNNNWKATEKSPKITFTRNGIYEVTLKVTNTSNLSATATQKIKVEAACPDWQGLYFTVVQGNLWNKYTFEISQRNGPGGEEIAFMDWDFGEQIRKEVRFHHQALKHVYSFPEPGEYRVWYGVRLQGHEDCWYVMECSVMVINPARPRPELAGKTATTKKKSTMAKRVPYDSPEGSLLKKHMG